MVDTGGKKLAAYGGAVVVSGAHPSIFGNRGCGSETVSACAGNPQLTTGWLMTIERNSRL